LYMLLRRKTMKRVRMTKRGPSLGENIKKGSETLKWKKCFFAQVGSPKIPRRNPLSRPVMISLGGGKKNSRQRGYFVKGQGAEKVGGRIDAGGDLLGGNQG